MLQYDDTKSKSCHSQVWQAEGVPVVLELIDNLTFYMMGMRRSGTCRHRRRLSRWNNEALLFLVLMLWTHLRGRDSASSFYSASVAGSLKSNVRQTNSKGTLSLRQTETSPRNLDPAKEIAMVVMQAPSTGLNLRSNSEQITYLHKLLFNIKRLLHREDMTILYQCN